MAPTNSFSVAEAAQQITRTNAHWGPTLGQPASVTYAFRAFVPDGYQMDPDSLEGNSFLRLNGGQITAVRSALQLWSDVANISFVAVREATSGYSNNATMLFGTYLSTTDNAAAFAASPGATEAGARAGDVWLNRGNFAGNGSIGPGDYNFETLIHEIGHAIGLKHPGDYNALPTPPPPAPAPKQPTYLDNALYAEDHRQYTLMSYFTVGEARNVESPLLHDIAAVQRLYGANLNTRLGDDVYGFNTTVRGPSAASFDFTINKVPHVAIWDAGGTDTFDVSGFAQNQLVELRAGFFSNIGGKTANVTMAALVRNAAGEVVNWIENAIGGAGADTLIGNEVDNVLEGGPGGDALSGLDGFDFASYARATAGVSASLFSPLSNNSGDAAGDTYQSIEGLIGSAFGDTLRGDFADNTLYGGDGNDRLDGGIGRNTLWGGRGNDTLVSGSGPDEMNGGSGIDVASYEKALAPVRIWLALAGADAPGRVGDAVGDSYVSIEGLRGSNFNDTLLGFVAADRLEGGEGQDSLDGSSGNDTLSGEAGDDLLRGGLGADSLNGGEGIDTADYSRASGAVSVALALTFTETGALFTNTGEAAGDRFVAVENLRGSEFGDTLVGSSAANRLDGGLGWDRLVGRGGDDTYDIGAINSVPMVGTVWDEVIEAAREGFDTVQLRATLGLFSSVPSAYYTLGANLEAAEAVGEGRFTLVGNVLNNRLIGSFDNDRLVAGDGADTMGGGGGADTLFGEFGDDVYILNDVTATAFSLAQWDEVLEPLNGGNDTVIVTAAPFPTLPFLFNSSYTLGANVENGWVYDERDFTLVGNVLDNDLDGGNGNDRIVAGDGADTLWGALGADTLFGEYGDDTYILRDVATPPAAPGSIALEGWDLILEAAPGGIDTVLVERAARSGFGGVQFWRSDYTLAEFIENGVVTGSEAFTLSGNALANRLTGNGAANFLLGQDGADMLLGGGGADALNGGAQADRLLGGAEADTLDGGTGRDILTGDEGADCFVFGAPPPATEIDLITDFLAGTDRIVLALSGFDPAGLRGLAAGSLEGQAGHFFANLSGQAGQRGVAAFTYETDAGRLWWDADGLGGAVRVQVAAMSGLPALTAADILLV
jgi:serralysin